MNTTEVQERVVTTSVQFHNSPVVLAEVVEEPTYCATHPAVATWMRCNKCSGLICLKCAVQTPVGYRCKACVRVQQNVYFNAQRYDNPLAFAVSAVLAAVAGPVAGILLDSFYFFGFYLAFVAGPGAGMILAQIVCWAAGRRRSRYTPYFVVGGIVIGLLAGIGAASWVGGYRLWVNAPFWIFTFLAATTAYRVLR